MTVRPAESADRKGFHRLLDDFQEYHNSQLPRVFMRPQEVELSKEDYEALIHDPSRRVLVADNGSTLVGGLIISRNNVSSSVEYPRQLAELELIVVRENYRRHGIASQLVEAALVWAREQGLTSASLNVWSFNEEALAFFRRHGFATRFYRMHRSID